MATRLQQLTMENQQLRDQLAASRISLTDDERRRIGGDAVFNFVMPDQDPLGVLMHQSELVDGRLPLPAQIEQVRAICNDIAQAVIVAIGARSFDAGLAAAAAFHTRLAAVHEAAARRAKTPDEQANHRARAREHRVYAQAIPTLRPAANHG
jgi:hypothetical protein